MKLHNSLSEIYDSLNLSFTRWEHLQRNNTKEYIENILLGIGAIENVVNTGHDKNIVFDDLVDDFKNQYFINSFYYLKNKDFNLKKAAPSSIFAYQKLLYEENDLVGKSLIEDFSRLRSCGNGKFLLKMNVFSHTNNIQMSTNLFSADKQHKKIFTTAFLESNSAKMNIRLSAETGMLFLRKINQGTTTFYKPHLILGSIMNAVNNDYDCDVLKPSSNLLVYMDAELNVFETYGNNMLGTISDYNREILNLNIKSRNDWTPEDWKTYNFDLILRFKISLL